MGTGGSCSNMFCPRQRWLADSAQESIVQILGHRPQRTLRRPVEISGIGFLSGDLVSMRLLPGEEDSGIVFRRVDLPGLPEIPAGVRHVTGTARRTTLGHSPCDVGLVEHVLSALGGMKVDNCVIEVDAAEAPGVDGSAGPFVEAIFEAGIVTQKATRPVMGVERMTCVRAGNATVTLHPTKSTTLTLSYLLDYGSLSPISRQMHTMDLSPENYRAQLAWCRTFLLREEADALLQQGLGSKTTLNDLLVFSRLGVEGNRLRFGNEPARHKMLDLIGDLNLLGFDIAGHLVGCRSGHPLNVELARQVLRQQAESALDPPRILPLQRLRRAA